MMAVQRDNPYGGFNFLVNLGGGSEDTASPAAGFSEVLGLGLAVGVIEYRNGNDRSNFPRKLPGLPRVSEVRLCRGLIGDLSLFTWVQNLSSGTQDVRTVTIQLKSEDHSQTVLTWTLTNAIAVSYSTPALSAVKNAVAIEELVIACQTITVA
jgi:phage tail-like protein